MANLISTLRTIKPSLEEKRIIPTKVWSPLSSFSKMNKEQLAVKLAALSRIDSARYLKEKIELESRVDRYTREVKDAKRRLKESIEKIESIKSASTIESKKKEIERIMNNLLVQHFEYVEPGVTVFTTEFIKKDKRILGIYRIWIDWSIDDARRAIRIFNVYKRTPGYDHPCISNGKLCMGNSESVILQHFREKNVYVLVETLIAFLVSENISHGYIRDWDSFDRQCSKLTAPFKFEDKDVRPNTSSNGVDWVRAMRELEADINNAPQANDDVPF